MPKASPGQTRARLIPFPSFPFLARSAEGQPGPNTCSFRSFPCQEFGCGEFHVHFLKLYAYIFPSFSMLLSFLSMCVPCPFHFKSISFFLFRVFLSSSFPIHFLFVFPFLSILFPLVCFHFFHSVSLLSIEEAGHVFLVISLNRV